MNTLKQDLDIIFTQSDSVSEESLDAFIAHTVNFFEALQKLAQDNPEEAKRIGAHLQQKLEAKAEFLQNHKSR